MIADTFYKVSKSDEPTPLKLFGWEREPSLEALKAASPNAFHFWIDQFGCKEGCLILNGQIAQFKEK